MGAKKKWYGDGIYSKTRQRRNGRPLEVFFGRVWVPTERRFCYFRLGTTPAQAERKMRTLLGDPEKAVAERRQKKARVLTFGELLGQFLEKYRSRGDTKYYLQVTKRLREHFGSTRVTEITPQALDRYLVAARTERTKGGTRYIDGAKLKIPAGERRISESTLRKQVIALGTVFRWAKRRGIMRENPIADYEKPKEPSERTIAVLSAEQEQALRAACAPEVWDVVEFALYSGMRLGEVLRLRWRDLDQAQGVIHTGSKTARAARAVPLNVSARLSAVLARRRRQVETDWKESGRVVAMPALVFCGREGEPLDAYMLNRRLMAAAQSAKIERRRGVLWNRFRHTWATRLAATGKVSLFEISKWMGNSVAICERHYAAYLPEFSRKAAGLLDAPPAPGGAGSGARPLVGGGEAGAGSPSNAFA
jgi:integrase